MKTCFEIELAAFTIRLQQFKDGYFSVSYGHQLDAGLTYADAAAKLGQAIMHAVACEGNLDNEEPWYEQDEELLR